MRVNIKIKELFLKNCLSSQEFASPGSVFFAALINNTRKINILCEFIPPRCFLQRANSRNVPDK